MGRMESDLILTLYMSKDRELLVGNLLARSLAAVDVKVAFDLPWMSSRRPLDGLPQRQH